MNGNLKILSSPYSKRNHEKNAHMKESLSCSLHQFRNFCLDLGTVSFPWLCVFAKSLSLPKAMEGPWRQRHLVSSKLSQLLRPRPPVTTRDGPAPETLIDTAAKEERPVDMEGTDLGNEKNFGTTKAYKNFGW